MRQISGVMRSRRTVIPVACSVGTVALAAGLFGAGAINAEQTAAVIFALYIGSKIFMAGVAIWVAARHSPRFRNFLKQRLTIGG